ncbi:MAG TPA: ABC-type transport auxiliary lipoprotein family protein [Burkholderiales bacterium]|nr:ABC-type transport auxiliary lipoprotein family protein [Burkholderiales bacterium]
MNRGAALALALTLTSGCAGMSSQEAEAPATFLLDARPPERPVRAQRDLVLLVGAPRARPGYDSAQIVFLRRPYEIEYFTKSRWADTPARMLWPLFTLALDRSGAFRTVVQAPSGVPADVRLDTELVLLRQDFGTQPSRVELALRAQLLDLRSNRVIAEMQFEEVESAPSEDAYGGVIAANRALQRLLARLVDFCIEQSNG